MHIKERIEQNPFVYLFIVIVFIGGVEFGILQYFHSEQISLINKKNELNIADLKIKLSSIKRGIGESEYFNIKSVFITKDNLTDIPQNSVYYSDGQFYSLKDSELLKFKKFSIPEFYEFALQKEYPSIQKDYFANWYQYVWMSESELRVEGIEGINLISPRVTVRKIAREEFMVVLMSLYHRMNIGELIDKYKEMGKYSLDELDTTKLILNLEKIYRGNINSVLLDHYLIEGLTNASTNFNVHYELLNISSFENILYVQGLTTLDNVIIDGNLYNKYYLRDEEIILCNFKDVYIISTFTPSEDPSTRNIYFQEITNWLTNFRIIIDK